MPEYKKVKLSETLDVQSRAEKLVHRLSQGCKQNEGFGTFTTAWYDTAWLSMVTREVDESPRLLFPRSFEALSRAQSKDGSWGKTQWPIDGLLSSLAALLCLVTHRENATPLSISGSELHERIQNARSWISISLQDWDVESCVHVGFEILVPALLNQLAGRGITFEFPQKNRLNVLNKKKLAKFDHRILYTDKKTTLTHSLEAFVGVLDFNRVKHHLTDGSMLGSPASTAAYLMNVSVWDSSAENYLEIVSQLANVDGGSPSAFPSSIFESSWAMSALLSSTLDTERLLNNGGRDVIDFLSETLREQQNITGFYPGSLVDADDTAKSIYALSKAGIAIPCQPMIDEFETESYFRTYRLETKPSFSANCNVLLALLARLQHQNFSKQIEITVSYLLTAWRAGPVMDKWNLSPVYSIMLLCQCSRDLLLQWDRGRLKDLTSSIPREDVPLMLVQMASRLVRSQRNDGSWEGMLEPTAYAVIALDTFMSLPVDREGCEAVQTAYARGREYLEARSDQWRDPDSIWVEKVSYGSPNLSEVYCIAATAPQTSQLQWSEKTKAIFSLPERYLGRMSPLMERLPLLKGHDPEYIRLALNESYFYLGSLYKLKGSIFPRREGQRDEYLSIVPFTWVCSSQLHDDCLPESVLREMMHLSILIYEADDFMESTVAELSGPSLDVLETIIRESCCCSDKWIRSSSRTEDFSSGIKFSENFLGQGHTSLSPVSQSPATGTPRLEDVSQVLEKFIRHVLQQPCLLEADAQSQQYVAHELCGFLLAHIRHIKDNSHFQSSLSSTSMSPSSSRQSNDSARQQPWEGDDGGVRCHRDGSMTYFDWVNTAAADDTSCPFAFAYFCCLMEAQGACSLPDVESRYLAQSLCRHLATMCRQYNDYGSLARDLAEGNLSSLNFPEFYQDEQSHRWQQQQQQQQQDSKAADPVGRVKARLMRIAQFERRSIHLALEELEARVDGKTADSVRAFVDVTDFYGQIYVVKDLTNRVK